MATISRNGSSALLLVAFLAIGIAIATANRRPQVNEVDIATAKSMIDAGAIVVDVREKEISSGAHIPGALLISVGVVAQRMAELSIDKSQPVVVYCNEGTKRGPNGTSALNDAGYSKAVNLKEGIEGWRAAGLPMTSAR